MAIGKVNYANDPRLRKKAKRVRQFGPALKALAEEMLETMRASDGVGLAAPQLGVAQRLFVAELPAEGELPLEQQFIASLMYLAAMKIDEKSVE